MITVFEILFLKLCKNVAMNIFTQIVLMYTPSRALIAELSFVNQLSISVVF